MSKPKIGIIISTTREGRFGDKPAQWIQRLAARRAATLDFEIVDLRDYPLPLFDEPRSPAYGPSDKPEVKRWQAKLAELDGFLFVTAGIQPLDPGGAEERARLRLCRVEPQAGRLRRLRPDRRRARGRAPAQHRGRAADGADPHRRAHHHGALSRGAEGREVARRLRAPEPGRRGDAGRARLVDEGAEGRRATPTAERQAVARLTARRLTARAASGSGRRGRSRAVVDEPEARRELQRRRSPARRPPATAVARRARGRRCRRPPRRPGRRASSAAASRPPPSQSTRVRPRSPSRCIIADRSSWPSAWNGTSISIAPALLPGLAPRRVGLGMVAEPERRLARRSRRAGRRAAASATPVTTTRTGLAPARPRSRTSSRGSSLRAVPAPTSTASACARIRCTSAPRLAAR